ncbi:SIGNAL peptide protein [Mucilaginibacter sp. PAMC 26640]|nr:SIGNAL peptide protein [Mucilaginibacter sp. PAMC 26640]
MFKNSVLALLFMLTCKLSVSAQNADAILGKWLNASGEGQVQIYKRGDKFFGKLAWLKFPNDAAGKAKLDAHNPDKSLQGRPELGIELLKNFAFDGVNVYEDGTIYDPKSGKTYSCKMTLNGDVLKIRGYIGISLFGRSENWTRIK